MVYINAFDQASNITMVAERCHSTFMKKFINQFFFLFSLIFFSKINVFLKKYFDEN